MPVDKRMKLVAALVEAGDGGWHSLGDACDICCDEDLWEAAWTRDELVRAAVVVSTPWNIQVPLFDLQGPIGARSLPEFDPCFVRVRARPYLFRLRDQVVSESLISCLLGLLNGDRYLGGLRPALDARWLDRALQRLGLGTGVEDVVLWMPNRAIIEFDESRFVQGHEVVLSTEPSFRSESELLYISDLPPDLDYVEALGALDRLTRGELHDKIEYWRESGDGFEPVLVLSLTPPVDAAFVVEALTRARVLSTHERISLGQSLSDLISGFLEEFVPRDEAVSVARQWISRMSPAFGSGSQNDWTRT